MSAPFSLSRSSLEDNTDGWGPVSIPDQFKDVPYYSSFNKSDKLGKAADWQAQFMGKSSRYQQRGDGGQNTIFNYYYQDEDSSFQLVDNTRTQVRRPFANRRFQQRGMQQRQPWTAGIAGTAKTAQPRQQQQRFQKQQGQRGRWGGRDQQNLRKREASLAIKSDWKEVDSIEFTKLARLEADAEPISQDLKTCGTLEYYDKLYDRVNSKAEKTLQKTDRVFYSVNTLSDPILTELAKADDVTVVATDSVLTHLMAATRTVYSWDIVAEKRDGKIFFDRRDGCNIDQLTVNETAPDPPSDDARDLINSAAALADEALLINQNFSQQILSKDKAEKFQFQEPHPFVTEGEVPATVGYKYRKWALGDGITLLARCEVDAVTVGKGKSGEAKNLLLTVKALSESAGGSDWRKKIDLQRGALLATEMKNNSSKVAKWYLQSALAGTDLIKLGFVSRQNPKDNMYHSIVALQDYNPKEFATTLGLNIKNSWAIFKHFVNVINKQEDGRYLIFREPDHNTIKVYAVPENAFDAPVPTKAEDSFQDDMGMGKLDI